MSDEPMLDVDQANEDADERARLKRLFAIADEAIAAGIEVMAAAVWVKADGTVGKAPLTVHGHLNAHRDRGRIHQELAFPPHRPKDVPEVYEVAVAIRPGSAGFVLLDGDVKHGKGGKAALKALVAQHGDFITAAWRSPSGGINVLLRKPPGAAYGNTSPWLGIDVRADAGWVIAPGNTCAGGEWAWLGTSSYSTASPLPPAMAEQLRAPSLAGPTATNAETVAFIEASPTGSTLPVMHLFREQTGRFRQARSGSRHDALVSIVSWSFGMKALDLRWALERINDEWGSLTAGEHRESEVGEVACWVAGKEIAKRAREAELPPPGVDPETGEILAASGADSAPTLQLPERFWQRPLLAKVRDAALVVGVSPEALVLAVIIVVAAHIPPAIMFPGKRRGVVNLFAAILGAPGLGKGTTLDRALELVLAPFGTKKFKPGTAQGLVKQFFRPATKAERDKDPDLPAFVRHEHPVILRTDEVGKFTAAAAGTNGQNLIAEIKSGVFGEGLGQSVATDEKNLQCDERSYRFVGLLGVAPGVAGPLFDDKDGGLPQRLLFANLLRDGQEPSTTLAPFDDMATDDVAVEGGGQYVALDPLRWKPPPAPALRQSFADSRRVAERIEAMLNTRWDLLDAHAPYLTHAVAAVLAYFDGRWLIQPADLTLAGDVVAVSRATRSALLAGLARSAATGKKHEREERRDEAVETADAVHARALDLDRLDYARRIVAEVRERTAEDGRPPAARDLYRNKSDQGAWRLAYEEAITQGWLCEEPEETEAGGSQRRTVFLTETAP